MARGNYDKMKVPVYIAQMDKFSKIRAYNYVTKMDQIG